MSNYKNENDLIYAIAARVKLLAGQTLPDLRYYLGVADTWHGAQREGKAKHRGELIEEIILEEFIAEFPRDFEEP